MAAYHVQQEFPIVDLLVCDDAPQYTQLTEALAGCWVHDGRHYKKLMPVVAAHRQALNDFLDEETASKMPLSGARQVLRPLFVF